MVGATAPSEVVFTRGTTGALNTVAYGWGLDHLEPGDRIVLTIIEHHSNLVPWQLVARRTGAELAYLPIGPDYQLDLAEAAAIIDDRTRIVAVTAMSNVTGTKPPVPEVAALAHAVGAVVVVDGAQAVPHLPVDVATLGADFLAWSGHKMYAPFGAGVLIGPRHAFASGDPFLAGGGAVDLVDLDGVVWTDPPEREEAGSPNVLGAVALHAAIDGLAELGWKAVRAHDDDMARRLREGLSAIDGVRLLGTAAADGCLPVASFVVDGVSHALVAARLSAEHAIGVRHGCFCAHPYLLRLLALGPDEVADYQAAVRRGDRRRIPGAVRASAGLSTTAADIDRLVEAVARIASGEPSPVPYDLDVHTGDYWPRSGDAAWSSATRRLGAPCARG
jgi:selenocysteine lyase/cysteine desulfurase